VLAGLLGDPRASRQHAEFPDEPHPLIAVEGESSERSCFGVVPHLSPHTLMPRPTAQHRPVSQSGCSASS
jgi:hypothetical protein